MFRLTPPNLCPQLFANDKKLTIRNKYGDINLSNNITNYSTLLIKDLSYGEINIKQSDKHVFLCEKVFNSCKDINIKEFGKNLNMLWKEIRKQIVKNIYCDLLYCRCRISGAIGGIFGENCLYIVVEFDKREKLNAEIRDYIANKSV